MLFFLKHMFGKCFKKKKVQGARQLCAMTISGLSNLSNLRVLPSGELAKDCGWGGGGQSLERQQGREGGRSQGETVFAEGEGPPHGWSPGL